jgi:hypothetical protein
MDEDIVSDGSGWVREVLRRVGLFPAPPASNYMQTLMILGPHYIARASTSGSV